VFTGTVKVKLQLNATNNISSLI